MKIISTVILLVFTNLFFAQNNTFPDSGNVGIGTTTPSAKLDLRLGGWGNIPRILFAQAADNPSIRLYRPTGSGSLAYTWWIVADAYGNLIFNNGTSTNYGTESVNENITFSSNGKVGIGTSAPDEKLTVKGKIHTQEIRVDLNGAVAPDYVFEKSYNLKSLQEIENYIIENKHLPEIPSAKTMKKEGIYLKQMNLLLLKKIEELTLYAIKQEKNINKLNKENNKISELQNELSEVKKLVEQLISNKNN